MHRSSGVARRCRATACALALLFALPLAALAGVDHWSLLAPSSPAVNRIAIDPVRPTVLYASTISGLWKSLDGGATWRLLEAAPKDGLVVHDPVRSNRLYLSTLEGPYRSTDGGARWSKLPGLPTSSLFSTIAVAPGDPRVLYVAHASAGLFRSADGGATFENVLAVALPLQFELIIDPSNPDILYSTGGSGLHKSADGGHTLVPIGPPASGEFAIDPTNPRRLWLFAGNALNESTDGGATFTPLPGQPSNAAAVDILFDRADARRAVVATLGGVFRTRDGGRSWAALPVPPIGPTTAFGQPRQLLAHPRDSRFLWLTRDFAGLLRSRNGGDRWLPASPRDGGLVGLPGTEVAFDPASPSHAVTVDWSGVQKTTDSGRTWSRIGASPTGFPRHLVRDPGRPGRLLLAGFEAGLYESLDDGRTWRPFTLGDAGPDHAWFVHRVLPAGATPGELYVASQMGLHRSFDDGATWALVNNGLFLDPRRSFAPTDLLVDPGDPALVYTVVQGKLAWITANHPIWTVAHTPADTLVTSLALDATDPRVFHIGTITGVYTSRDGGVTWSAATGGTPPAGEVRSLLALGKTVWAGTADAIYRSRNGGLTWARVTTDGQGPDGVRSFSVDPSNPGRVFVHDRRGLTYTAELSQANALGITERYDVEVTWRRADGSRGVGRFVPDVGALLITLDRPGEGQLAVDVSTADARPGFLRASWRFLESGTNALDIGLTFTDRPTKNRASYIIRPGEGNGSDPGALLVLP